MASIGKERPNLKICIDNTEDADSSDESGGELPPTDGSSDEEPKSREPEPQISEDEREEGEDSDSVDDNEGRMTIAERKKYGVYQKPVDSDDEEEIARRRKEEWSKRYRVKVPESISSEIDLNKLYDSLGIKKKELEDGHNFRGIRLEAIHVRGVENMKTKEVCNYFKEYVPKTVEWIDECSCNAVWDDVAASIRAMNALSQDQEEVDDSDEEEEEKKDDKKEEDEDELNLMSDEEMEVEEGEIKETKESKTKNEKKMKFVITPPGRWRVGKKYKSKRLFLRFAMRADKKFRGAERRSKKFKVYTDHEEDMFQGNDLSEPGLRPDLPEHDKHPKVNTRPTHVFEATPDDYDLEETFGVVSSKPKKNLKPISAYMDAGEIVGPSYEETLAMYSRAAKDRLAAREQLGVTSDEPEVRRPPKRRHSGSDSDSSDVDYEEELQTLLRQPVDKKKMRMYADDMDEDQDALRASLAKSKSSVLDARSRIECRKLERKLNESDGSGSGNDLRRKLQKRKSYKSSPPSKFHNLHNLKVQIDTD